MRDCENNMREEADVGFWTPLLEKCKRLEKENEDLQNSHMQLYNDTKDEIRKLKEENAELKAGIQKIMENQREDCSRKDDLPFPDEPDTDDLLCELKDQHQQDCIRINDLTTTVNVLSRLYVNLRKNVGMD